MTAKENDVLIQERTELFGPDDYLRIEKWVEDIKEVTFETDSFDLSEAECDAIRSYRDAEYQKRQMLRLLAEQDSPNPETLREVEESEPLQMISTEDRQLVRAVERKIEQVLSRWRDQPKEGEEGKQKEPFAGAFVKLSTRSPKDAALRMASFYSGMEEDLKDISGEDQSSLISLEEWQTAALQSFTRRGIQVLKVSSGPQAMDLLLASTRVYQDITNLKLLQGPAFQMKLVLRRWWAAIDPAWEFRAFVNGGQLRAVTQYYSRCYVPEISRHRLAIAQGIWDYFETQVQPRLSFHPPKYTVDFAVLPSDFSCDEGATLDPSNLRVVELGHSWPTAGTSLFDVTDERDRDILDNGPYQLRVLESSPPDVLATVDPIFFGFWVHVAPPHLKEQVSQIVGFAKNEAAKNEAKEEEKEQEKKSKTKECCLM